MRYYAFVAEKLAADASGATDDLMVQKILVKLRGSGTSASLLTDLSRPWPAFQSRALLEKLLADLDEFGAFQASR